MLWKIFTVVALSFVAFAVAELQSVGVRGTLLCKGEPAGDVLLKLYDVRKGKLDQLMTKTKTTAEGKFEVYGTLNQTEQIDPKFNVYHNCEDGWKPCSRKVPYFIPEKYVLWNTTYPNVTYNIGTVELSEKQPNETRSCFH